MTESSRYKAGYSAAFDPPLDKKHECPVCLLALREPIQTACGHRFCTGCIKQILQKAKPRCPVDNEALNQDEIFPDKFCRREVLSLTILCTNKQLGCTWKGLLKELETHESLCDFMVVNCTNDGCSLSFPQKDLSSHLQTDCKFRLVGCQLCGQQFVFSKEKEHFDSDCLEVEISCENECGLRLKRREYEEHVKISCQRVKLACRFARVGCKFEGTRSDLDNHQADPKNRHTELILEQLETVLANDVHSVRPSSSTMGTSNQTIDEATPTEGFSAVKMPHDSVAMGTAESLLSAVDERDRTIRDLRQTVTNLTSKVENLTQAMQEIKTDMSLAHEERSSCSSRIAAFEQKHLASQGKISAMEHRQLAIEKTLAMRDNALAEHDVRLLSLEMTTYDAVLRWKITEFNRRKSEAIAGRRLSIYSPPFFTSRCGYKMCARIYLNGDGMGKGSHLSLFFVIMKGEYDALLPWPFQQRVTFTLIDQEHRRHVSDTFQPDPSSSSFQRPVGDMNVASGCPLFVPLEALETRGYVKDDTMFVRVAVDAKGLIHP